MSEIFHATDSQVKRLGARTDTLEETAKTLTKGLADEIARAKREENRVLEAAVSSGSAAGSSAALGHIDTIEKIIFPALDTLKNTDKRHDCEISELRSCIDCSIVGDLCSLENTVYCDHEPRIQSLEGCVDSSFSLLGSLENSLTNYGCSLDGLSCCYSSLSSTVSELDNNVESLSTRIDNIPTEYPYLPLDVTCDTTVTVGWCNTLLFKDSKNNTLIRLTPNDTSDNNGITIGYNNYNNGVKLLGHSVIVDSNVFEVDSSSNFIQGLSAINKVYAECGLYVGCNNEDGYAISTNGDVLVGGGSITAESGSVSASDEVNGRWFNAYCFISVGYDYPSLIEGECGLLKISSCCASIFTNNETSLYVGSCFGPCFDPCLAETKVSLTNRGVYFDTPIVEFSCHTDVRFCGCVGYYGITASSISFYDYSCGCNYVGSLGTCGNCMRLSANNLDINADYSINIVSCGNEISLSQNGIVIDGTTTFCGDVNFSGSISTDYLGFCSGNIYSCGNTLCLNGCNLDIVSRGKIRIIDDCYYKGISVGCDCVSIDANVNFLGACNIILDGSYFVFGGMAVQDFQNGSVQYFSCGTSSTFYCGSNLFIENGAGITLFGGVDDCGKPTGESVTLNYATVKKLLALLPAG